MTLHLPGMAPSDPITAMVPLDVAAELTGTTPALIRQGIRTGSVPTEQINGKTYVDLDAVIALRDRAAMQSTNS